MAQVNVRIDDKVKKEAEEVFEDGCQREENSF